MKALPAADGWSPALEAKAQELGIRAVGFDTKQSVAAIAAEIADANVLINLFPGVVEVAARLPNLKLVQGTSAGCARPSPAHGPLDAVGEKLALQMTSTTRAASR